MERGEKDDFVLMTPIRPLAIILQHICQVILDIKHETQDKTVENTTRSGIFLTNFEVFHLVMKYCVQCLILLLKQNDLVGKIKDVK